jgi:hypothetical protein
MSIPSPRRIAKAAALLVGAAAAPLIGAGAADAATALPPAELGGLTHVGSTDLSGTVDGATRHATGLATTTGTDAVEHAVPAAGRIVGTTGHIAVPAARQTTDHATDTAGRVLGTTTETASGVVPAGLPAAAPLHGLPVG